MDKTHEEVERIIIKAMQSAGGSITSNTLWEVLRRNGVDTNEGDTAIKRLKNSKVIKRGTFGRMVWELTKPQLPEPHNGPCRCTEFRALLEEALTWMRSGNEVIRAEGDIDGECVEADAAIKKIEEALAS